ncbi:MAG TPA: hypothetical protein H9717_07270 [Candidatus Eisenbergiella merdipullorum]|uniref:Uncharacterized protein n=1 Tax=Candidatus Eisenbergiella merdipullorum TaxID=2838553 RepID=A0A9D2I713_9FIRM|nr:hypothetical protein [Candidatus Eisenbergiella merdipullorum]
MTDGKIAAIMGTTNRNKSVDEEEYMLPGCTERRWPVRIFVKEAWK